MSNDNRLAVRFAVGATNERRSSVWKVWTPKSTEKSDVYLTSIPLGGALKVSLHESGTWQISFTGELEQRLRKEGNWKLPSRHITRWSRPPEIAPGITIALRVLFPTSELREAPIPVQNDKPTEWIHPAASGHAIEFAILFGKPGAQEVSTWPGKNSMNTSLLAQALLPNRNTVWIVHYGVELNRGSAEQLEQIRVRAMSGQPKILGGKIGEGEGLRGAAIGPEPDGSYHIIEFALDRVMWGQLPDPESGAHCQDVTERNDGVN